MSRTIHAAIPVTEVVGKGRPRATTQGGHVRMYTTARTREFERQIREGWLACVSDDRSDYNGPVTVDMCYQRELAKTNPKRLIGTPDVSKPDIDNVYKAVLDALTGVAFADDCQVVRGYIEKGARVAHGRGSTVFVTVTYGEVSR